IAGLPRGIGCVGLRQLAVGTGAYWIEAVGVLGVGGPLLGKGEIAAGLALRVDDVLRQKVHCGLPRTRGVGTKDSIEGMVLADDDNDMFDRRGGAGLRHCAIRANASQKRRDEYGTAT